MRLVMSGGGDGCPDRRPAGEPADEGRNQRGDCRRCRGDARTGHPVVVSGEHLVDWWVPVAMAPTCSMSPPARALSRRRPEPALPSTATALSPAPAAAPTCWSAWGAAGSQSRTGGALDRRGGSGFYVRPAHHSAMRHAVGPRRELGMRTLFNILGPLTNPAHVKRQVIGVFPPNCASPWPRS